MTNLVEVLQATPHDQTAWSSLFARVYPRVVFSAFRLCRGNREIAEEVAQEAFVRFIRYEGIRKVGNEEEAASFLCMTARNVYFDSVRRWKATEPLDESSDASSSSAKEPAALDRDIDLRGALTRLDTAERSLCELCLVGYSTSEIASHLGISYGAAAVRVHRLRRRLGGNKPLR